MKKIMSSIKSVETRMFRVPLAEVLCDAGTVRTVISS